MAGEDLCRREGQWAARVERLHNVEQLHDIVRQRLTDVRSRGPFGVPLHGDSWFNSGDPSRSEIPLS
jgi:hypothetical protein